MKLIAIPSTVKENPGKTAAILLFIASISGSVYYLTQKSDHTSSGIPGKSFVAKTQETLEQTKNKKQHRDVVSIDQMMLDEKELIDTIYEGRGLISHDKLEGAIAEMKKKTLEEMKGELKEFLETVHTHKSVDFERPDIKWLTIFSETTQLQDSHAYLPKQFQLEGEKLNEGILQEIKRERGNENGVSIETSENIPTGLTKEAFSQIEEDLKWFKKYQSWMREEELKSMINSSTEEEFINHYETWVATMNNLAYWRMWNTQSSSLGDFPSFSREILTGSFGIFLGKTRDAALENGYTQDQ